MTDSAHHILNIPLKLSFSHVNYHLVSPSWGQEKVTKNAVKPMSALRGALGYALREVTCVGLCEGGPQSDEKKCQEPSCPYSRGFLALGTAPDAPSPYRLCLSPLSCGPGELHVRVALFGPLSDDHLYWLWGLQRALQRPLKQWGEPHQLLCATDLNSQESLWDLRWNTFPSLPKIIPLAQAVEERTHTLISQARNSITLHFLSPLELKKELPSEVFKGRTRLMLSLEDIPLLIVRRAERLYETYLLPIEPDEGYQRTSRHDVKTIAHTTSLKHIEIIERSSQYRGIKSVRKHSRRQYIGACTYILPPDLEQRRMLLTLLSLGELIGIGVGVVEGNGTYQISLQ